MPNTPAPSRPEGHHPVSVLESGWCHHCGRRRGSDGRCQNCDPWWTMGVVQTGVPMVLAGGLLTFLLVRLAAPSPDPQRSSFTRSPVSGARPPLAAPSVAPPVFGNSSPGTLSSATPASGVLVFPKAPAPAAPPPPVDREQTALRELEELRVVVWQADRIARARLEGTNVASLSPQTTIEESADR